VFNDDHEERAGYPIGEWCSRVGISTSFYYKLQVEGRGPRVMRLGGRTLVTETPREFCMRHEAAPVQPRLTKAV
jgi:hypothetical protein